MEWIKKIVFLEIQELININHPNLMIDFGTQARKKCEDSTCIDLSHFGNWILICFLFAFFFCMRSDSFSCRVLSSTELDP